VSETWANPGPDLLLELRGTRRRAGLEDALREAVRSGRLVPGTLLPSSRALAAELSLARNTVADAYGQLVAEGWLTARQGAGTRVAESAGPPPGRALEPRPYRPARNRSYDLSPGVPDLSAFPRAAWLAAARKALTAAPSAALGYPDPAGLPALRRTLAHYLARVRGVRAAPENIVICSGFAQAITLLATVLRDQGAQGLAIEGYGLREHRKAITAAGLATPVLGVDGSGARVSQLAGTGAGGVLLTPAHQFPLGVPLAARRRAAVLQWARDHGGLVIEDDYDGEFRYDRRPLGALQGLAPGLVAYAGTASKSLAPALGLAWLAVPPQLASAVMAAKVVADGYTGIFEQLTLAEFIDSGQYDRHIRRSRLRYRRRRDRLTEILAQRHPGVRVTGIAAGLHVLAELGGALREADEVAVVSRAARAGLNLRGLGWFRQPGGQDGEDGHDGQPPGSQDDQAPAALVVGYGTPPEHAFAGALDTLCDVLP
jgi:GntR family transcriptional regulator/MocR family aminotransferase